MDTTKKKSKGMYWLLTLVSVVAMFAMLNIQPGWSWVTFPFVGTFLVLAMDVI
jgi:hypothetical protein